MLVLLYHCVPNIKINYSIDSVNVLQVRAGKNPTAPSYNETKKLNFFEKKHKVDNKKENILLKILQERIMLKF